jgi:hypothetical protein
MQFEKKRRRKSLSGFVRAGDSFNLSVQKKMSFSKLSELSSYEAVCLVVALVALGIYKAVSTDGGVFLPIR